MFVICYFLKNKLKMSQICRVNGPKSYLVPSLMIIGSMKSGSTELWSHLFTHCKNTICFGKESNKGRVSLKEKDFFGDPNMFARGFNWYERLWPECTDTDKRISLDATPAYHVFYNAPNNIASFYNSFIKNIRLVWMMREPATKMWSYYGEISIYEKNPPSFKNFILPKLERANNCIKLNKSSPLWPPSLPPPFKDCAPHLDHGLYHSHFQRWIQYFKSEQFLVVSFKHFIDDNGPAEVVRDVLSHAKVSSNILKNVYENVKKRKKPLAPSWISDSRNSRSKHRPPSNIIAKLAKFYAPFNNKLYDFLKYYNIKLSPAWANGTRFLDLDTNEKIKKMLTLRNGNFLGLRKYDIENRVLNDITCTEYTDTSDNCACQIRCNNCINKISFHTRAVQICNKLKNCDGIQFNNDFSWATLKQLGRKRRIDLSKYNNKSFESNLNIYPIYKYINNIKYFDKNLCGKNIGFKKYFSHKFGILAITYKTPLTLENSMKSWMDGGLLSIASEKLLIANHPTREDYIISHAYGFQIIKPDDMYIKGVPVKKTSYNNILIISLDFNPKILKIIFW